MREELRERICFRLEWTRNETKEHIYRKYKSACNFFCFQTHITNWTMTVDQSLASMADERSMIDCWLDQLMILYLNLMPDAWENRIHTLILLVGNLYMRKC